MSQQVKVQKAIQMTGSAKHGYNAEGPLMEKKRHSYCLFDGIALDTTNDWAVSVPGSSDTIAISEVQGGSVLITTGTVDNDSCMLASPIIFSGTKKAIVEFKITITDVSGTGVFVGFSDAKSHDNQSIAIHYLDDVLTTVATDAAGFVIDADHATSSIMCASVANGTDTTPVDTGIDWTDGQTKRLRVELDDTRAYFYIDGAAVATIASSVTAATLLCATVQAITRAADGANTVRVHRYDAWQDE